MVSGTLPSPELNNVKTYSSGLEIESKLTWGSFSFYDPLLESSMIATYTFTKNEKIIWQETIVTGFECPSCSKRNFMCPYCFAVFHSYKKNPNLNVTVLELSSEISTYTINNFLSIELINMNSREYEF